LLVIREYKSNSSTDILLFQLSSVILEEFIFHFTPTELAFYFFIAPAEQNSNSTNINQNPESLIGATLQPYITTKKRPAPPHANRFQRTTLDSVQYTNTVADVDARGKSS
jgi:hypothetical protein